MQITVEEQSSVKKILHIEVPESEVTKASWMLPITTQKDSKSQRISAGQNASFGSGENV